ncbi:MAG: acyltransferase domain-containing protein [Sphingobacteriaceae bacterium]|nr:acyltransferase domain-containing protein [Sphingobacteriaceae bacterium]
MHVVLEGYEKSVSRSNDKKGLHLHSFCTSYRCIKAYTESCLEFIKDKNNRSSFSDICYSSAVRNSHHDMRLAFVAESKEELAKNMQIYLNGETVTGIAEGRTNEKKEKIVFIFSGQGPQWWGMGRQLFEKEPLFRETITKRDKMLSVHFGGWSLMEELARDGETSRISETNIANPAIFAIQIGLFEMWKAMGVTPSAVVGHSIGEVAAGYASGALTLEQAVLLIFHRSRVQHKATDKGKMLAAAQHCRRK